MLMIRHSLLIIFNLYQPSGSVARRDARRWRPSSVGGDSGRGGDVSRSELKPKEAEERRKEAGIR